MEEGVLQFFVRCKCLLLGHESEVPKSNVIWDFWLVRKAKIKNTVHAIKQYQHNFCETKGIFL